ncbi:ABC-2 type transport system ATP-binding protein [Singulisphaera sp. GP187]|uniref:ABC transporter ATP-binding protein n=1 Tax=Singulisphaera sp. GP187 TaxID=1882752 RepID=UPI00092849CA|nr:ABC transporter ATP-binding protein [Singulisphaera sp. GP187]SIO08022.1 ABC-2 type transport system ATP-binding protein [Singulisphaera sp. GP187]
MIVTEGLTKRYGAVTALADLSMTVRRGEVFGLLGPNGSGKTTTIRLLLGLLKPSSGWATVGGHHCWSDSLEVRRLVTYLPGELRMFGSMSGLGMLRYLSDLRGGDALDRAVALAERVMRLDLRRKVRTYSTGMKQKLALAQAFSDPVEILILDEPTSALDPSARAEVLDLVRQARDVQKQTVVFSGHVLSEVEEVSDRVAIMREGRLLHLEDMHERRSLRMVLLRFAEGVAPSFPDELELTVRERNGSTCLLEHRGRIGTLLSWLSRSPIEDVAIGTDDLRSLYEQYHSPVPADSEVPTR